jgi:hypothetical protein
MLVGMLHSMIGIVQDGPISGLSSILSSQLKRNDATKDVDILFLTANSRFF